jgi:hypothetical protein
VHAAEEVAARRREERAQAVVTPENFVGAESDRLVLVRRREGRPPDLTPDVKAGNIFG